MSSHPTRRVLLVGKGPPDTGGIAAVLLDTLRSGIPGFDVELLNLSRAHEPAAFRLSAANVRRTVVDAWRLARAARGRDIVHIHTAFASGITTLARVALLCVAARTGATRVVVHAHGSRTTAWLTTPARRLLVRIAVLAADRILSVDRAGTDALRAAVGEERVVEVPNGVDTTSFRPTATAHDVRRPPRILFAGYLTPRKGLLELLDASSQLRADGIAHELVLAGGPPPEAPELDPEIRRAADAAGAVLLGAQPRAEMPDLYRAADLFCLPSWGEAMPVSVLEAMATGLPVVASAVGEVPFVVDDGVSGLVVPPRRSDALARALRSVLIDPERRRALGTAARERAVARFDAGLMRARLADVYEELLRR